MIKICHLTSVHERNDTRISVKECSCLSKAGHEVSLLVADGLGDEEENGVKIIDCGSSEGFGRFKRMSVTVKNVYNKALEVDADIYHFHDPELLRVGWKLKKMGKKVIYDAHEDVPRQILSKLWLPFFLRRPVSYFFEKYEDYVVKRLSAVVCATPFIHERFSKINSSSITVNNFPILEEFPSLVDWSERRNEVCYVGGLTRVRGIAEIVDSLSKINTRLNLAGKFMDPELEREVKSNEAWEKVNYLGYVGREEISKVLAQSKIGLVTLHPIINYLDSLPVKMFEYMAAGLPVVASDFPYWRKVLADYDCAVFVDPLDSSAMSMAINDLLNDDTRSSCMGQNGRKAVEEVFNWQSESQKLLNLYSSIGKNE